MTREEIRLKCAEVALIACTKADIQREGSLPFAEAIFSFVTKAQDTKKKETPA